MLKTILVTGGAGFIGSHLCNLFIQRGDKVICIDNLISGSQKNISAIIGKKNFTFINQDVSEHIEIKKMPKLDEIYHLASPADPNVKSPVSYMSHPFETMLVNTVGTWNMCELAVKHNAKLLFTSTSEVYGDPLVSPQNEEYRGNVSTIGPRSVYDEAKRFGETIVMAFAREKKLDGRITRIFNTYGPNMNPNEGRAVVNFIKQALTGQPFTIYGDGKQTRSFCYIDDQINGQILAMEKKGTKGEVINIGNDDERTILGFAQIIKRLSESKSQLVYEPFPVDDPMQRRPDITKAIKILGWSPKIKIENGLTSTINYFKQII